MYKSFFLLFVSLLSFNLQAQTLEEYLVLAGENNAGLKAKYFEYQAALEKVPQVGSLPDPQLTFGYFILPPETRVGPQLASFSVSQMFPWFGSLSASKDAAALMAKAKFEAFEAQRNLLYYQVKTTYFQLWELKQQITFMSENLDILKSYESLAITKYENGKVGLVDVLRVQIQIEEAANDLLILQQKTKPLKVRFNSLLNRETDTEVEISMLLSPVKVAPAVFPDDLLEGNPLISELDLKAQAFTQNLTVAKKMGMPKIGLGLNYTIVKPRTDMDVPDNGKDILMPMVTLSLPIYRKKYNAMQNEVTFQLDAVKQKRIQTTNLLTADYADANWNYLDAQSRLVLYNGQIQRSESALNILITSYSSDNNAFEEVLRMQQQILQYKLQLAKANADLRIAIAKTDYLTGK